MLAVGLLLSVVGLAQNNSSNSTNSMSKSADMNKSSDTMNSAKGSSSLSSADQNFVKKAAEGGMAEVELGNLAKEKASSSEVKQFAQRMVDDHTKANDQLKSIASEKGVTLPTSLDSKDQALKDRLSSLSGEQFDRTYMDNMVKDHTKDVSEFRKEANSGKDPDVKSFADKTLPTLESHLKEARQIAPKERKEAANKKSSGQ